MFGANQITLPGLRLQVRPEILAGAALGAVIFFAFYHGLGAYGLLNNNEGLYAEIAREMLQARAWVIPTLDHVPYIEKPPLLYWLVAASDALFGVTETAARLVPATAAALLCLGLVGFGRRIGRPQTGWLAAFVLASSFGFALLARAVMFDMLLTALLALALLRFYCWYQDGRPHDLRLAYLFLGLAVMAKGFVALALAALTVTAFFLLASGDRRRLRALVDVPGILLFLGVTVPWHLAAALADPGFAWFYFINEHVMRFLGRRMPHDYHAGPFYYYVPLVLAGTLPWSGWLLAGLRRVTTRDPFEKFLLVWFAAFFLFFSAASDKGDYYLVTALPAAALLIALQIERYTTENKAWRNRLLAAAGVAAAVMLTAWVLWPYHGLLRGSPAWRTACAMLLLAGLAIALTLMRRAAAPSPWTLVIALASLVAPFTQTVVAGMAADQSELTEARFARAITGRTAPYPLLLYRDFEQVSSLLFYLRRPLPVVDSTSKDLDYGQHTPAARQWFPSSGELARRAASGKLYVLVRDERRREFETRLRGVGFCRVMHGDGLTLYGNDRRECAAGHARLHPEDALHATMRGSLRPLIAARGTGTA
jgi:4-amino-4-deoxy-L-arabinose transferase-like glycosyltransferase